VRSQTNKLTCKETDKADKQNKMDAIYRIHEHLLQDSSLIILSLIVSATKMDQSHLYIYIYIYIYIYAPGVSINKVKQNTPPIHCNGDRTAGSE